MWTGPFEQTLNLYGLGASSDNIVTHIPSDDRLAFVYQTPIPFQGSIFYMPDAGMYSTNASTGIMNWYPAELVSDLTTITAYLIPEPEPNVLP